MDIHGRSIPAVSAADQSLIADHFAVSGSDLLVPGLGYCHGIGEHLSCAAVDQAGCRIRIDVEGLVHGIDHFDAVAGLSDGIVIIFLCQLVQQLLPEGIVIVQSPHFDESVAVLFSEYDLVVKGHFRCPGLCGIQSGQIFVGYGLGPGIVFT